MINVPERVGKRRPQPICGGVARRAGGWDDSDGGRVGGEVIRYRSAQRLCALPLSGVATVAVGRRHGGTCVAEIASCCNVRAGEGETRRAVVEDCARPGNRGVARVTCLWIAQSHVVWNRPAQCGGALIKGIVATVASRRQRSGIVTVYMALRAGDSCGMRPGQREGRGAVIESGGRPIRRRVADGTVGRKAGRNMIWNRSA